MSNADSARLRRLNGRLQACDPCRKRKVACDHGQPVCQRCRRKQWDARCTYTITARSAVPFNLRSSTASTTLTATPSPPILQTAQYEAQVVQPTSTETGGDTVEGHTPASTPGAATATPNWKAPGYLGYASYSTVLEEARESLPVPDQDVGLKDDNGFDATKSGLVVSEVVLSACVAVLRLLPLQEDSGIPPHDFLVLFQWLHRLGSNVRESLYAPDIFGAYLGRRRDEASLRRMAYKICVNTTKPVDDDLDAEDWLKQFTGHNIRWESLGLLFTFWDTASRQQPPQFRNQTDTDQNWSRTREPLNRCLALCNEFSSGNLLMLLAFHRRTRLESMSSGDASLRSWKYHAQAVACLTFMGYHADPGTEPYEPTFTSEVTRLLCIQISGADKTFASFTGRPPLISKTFITTPMPLDLSDEDLFASRNELKQIVATTIDQNGWSTRCHVTAATIYRARSMLKNIREDILTISLGKEQNTSVDRLLQLAQEQVSILAQLPKSIEHRPEHVTDASIPSEVVLARLLIKMDALQSEFFLDRLLLKRGYDSSAHLLVTSFQLVIDTLVLWTNFERFAPFRRDFEWIVMAFGAPAGGILCKELQKPSFTGRHLQDPRITRSAIIQKLSLLVAFLEWVQPLAPNSDLCSDCRSVMQLVLDQALNGVGGPTGPPAPSSSTVTMADEQVGLEFLGKGLDFNFDLMDSFDWLTTEL